MLKDKTVASKLPPTKNSRYVAVQPFGEEDFKVSRSGIIHQLGLQNVIRLESMHRKQKGSLGSLFYGLNSQLIT